MGPLLPGLPCRNTRIMFLVILTLSRLCMHRWNPGSDQKSLTLFSKSLTAQDEPASERPRMPGGHRQQGQHLRRGCPRVRGNHVMWTLFKSGVGVEEQVQRAPWRGATFRPQQSDRDLT